MGHLLAAVTLGSALPPPAAGGASCTLSCTSAQALAGLQQCCGPLTQPQRGRRRRLIAVAACSTPLVLCHAAAYTWPRCNHTHKCRGAHGCQPRHGQSSPAASWSPGYCGGIAVARPAGPQVCCNAPPPHTPNPPAKSASMQAPTTAPLALPPPTSQAGCGSVFCKRRCLGRSGLPQGAPTRRPAQGNNSASSALGKAARGWLL